MFTLPGVLGIIGMHILVDFGVEDTVLEFKDVRYSSGRIPYTLTTQWRAGFLRFIVAF